ncbi:pre-rRNA-processing protein IPI1, partial [Lecanoromycetidae sp. Uapishka_2]
MGSSSRKKKEKAKDFKKPRLKVGKARPKPDNFTDTSFQSKSIVLAKQSLTTVAPTQSAQFSHHLSLLSSKTSTQRRDSLAFLTTAITSRPVNTPLPQPISVLLPKLNPLMLDGSNGVRSQLLRLLRTLPPQDIEPHIGQILLYVRTGLTHLAADIRSSATDILLWAIETCPDDELVSCAGGWVKTLKCLMTVLRWHGPTSSTNKASVGGSGWTSMQAPTLSATGAEGKLPVKTLNVLAVFLRAGLAPLADDTANRPFQSKWPFPLRNVEAHMLPTRSNAFARLNLFGLPRDEESEMYVEREERQRIFHKRFRATVEAGVDRVKKEGGEVGRAASEVGKALEDGMEGFRSDE